MIRHTWLQKHPSHLASSGEFHWYPDTGDRELQASFVERVRGIEPPAVLWQLERDRVAWGQVFSAVAPTDGARPIRQSADMFDDNADGKVDRVVTTFSAAERWHPHRVRTHWVR
jgi:hypothetical protein